MKETAKTTNKKTKIIILVVVCSILLIAGIVAGILIINNNNPNADDENIQMMSFSQAQSVSAMEEMNGKKVTIIGYMSTLSPIQGQFMYLMNLPYQSCPFCVPNTTTLSNTIAVYAEAGKAFEFTDRAIQVTGILEFGTWTDEFGYQYDYRIKDATFVVLNTEDMSEELKLWQSIASSNVISEVYTMFDYLSFVCAWPEYTANFGQPDYVYANDALEYISDAGYYNFGTKESYYQDIITKIEAVDPNKFEVLENIILKAKSLSNTAVSELEAGNYVVVDEYSNVFEDGRGQYKLNKGDELILAFQNLYQEFAAWLAEWEV